MQKNYQTEIQEEIRKISERIKQNRPLTEEELSILFLATFFDEESHESN